MITPRTFQYVYDQLALFQFPDEELMVEFTAHLSVVDDRVFVGMVLTKRPDFQVVGMQVPTLVGCISDLPELAEEISRLLEWCHQHIKPF